MTNGAIDLPELIKNLSKAGGVPITLSSTLPPVIDTGSLLTGKPRLTVVFPPCADELLSLIKTTGVTDENKDDITKYFDEYFKFMRHSILGQGLDTQLNINLDSALLRCVGGGSIIELQPGEVNEAWPTECCLCPPCVTLDGNRNKLTLPPSSPFPTPVVPSIKRLFVGDLLWLFYFERMGIFQILGAILDAFACNGRLPISNGSIDPGGIQDDIVALVLEVMVRQTKMGMSSTCRDRGCSYQTSLGWTSPAARKLGLDTSVNTGFNTLFHKFIFNALEFYKDKRLAVAIRGTAAPVAPPSVATLITVSDTLDVLKKRFEAFKYGRNYYNTLNGIVWVIAGMSVVRELRTTLGIPPAYDEPHEYIPAAYDLLVMKRPVTSGETNRYLVHRECARNGRDILLDLEVIKHEDKNPGGELENWLTQIEAKVEAFRTAYRTLTGVDLGASATPVIEQQV
ncbi:MAG: hypothetical protein CV087_07175 [Candidatus Brocadia sp. WS118]|nr:MAG: hypothetical protein CV087_07175 [Candidatus Brocadia sp. WS118]